MVAKGGHSPPTACRPSDVSSLERDLVVEVATGRPRRTTTATATATEVTAALARGAPIAAPSSTAAGVVISAAKVAMGAGCRMVIANGHELGSVTRIEDGAPCTWFIPKANPRTARKHWIAGTLSPSGKLIVDDGALSALESGKSLLPAGVTGAEGDFHKGDAVIVVDGAGREVARGLVAYSAGEARLLIGHKSSEIEDLLGYRGADELIHRDDLVLS